jgi:hypothetical protein
MPSLTYEVNSLSWLRRRYLIARDPEVFMDEAEATVRRMLKDGTFRGFGKLHRVTVQEFGPEPSQIWRTDRGNSEDRDGP